MNLIDLFGTLHPAMQMLLGILLSVVVVGTVFLYYTGKDLIHSIRNKWRNRR